MQRAVEECYSFVPSKLCENKDGALLMAFTRRFNPSSSSFNWKITFHYAPCYFHNHARAILTARILSRILIKNNLHILIHPSNDPRTIARIFEMRYQFDGFPRNDATVIRENYLFVPENWLSFYRSLSRIFHSVVTILILSIYPGVYKYEARSIRSRWILPQFSL